MFTENDYDLIDERWVTHDAIFKGSDSLTIVWFNPDSGIPSWEWATVYPHTILEVKEDYGPITSENVKDFCIDVSAASSQHWESFDPENEGDWRYEIDNADYVGSCDMDEAEWLINWASEKVKSYN